MSIQTQARERSTPEPIVLMIGTNPEMRGGIASVVASIRDGGFFVSANVRYVTTHVDGGALRKVRCFMASVLEVLRALRGKPPVALMHAHVSSKGSFLRKAVLLWLARQYRVPTVFHLHSGGFSDFAERGLPGLILAGAIRRTMESSSAVVVLSERWATWARRFAPRCHVRVVGNPVRLPEAATCSCTAKKEGEGGRVLFLGLIGNAKGVFDLLEAWSRVVGRLPGWRLVVGGNGEVARFQSEVKRLNIEASVDYIGWVTGEAKAKHLSGADIFVLPSYKEGMPVSILEAMVYGAAVIATPVGGVPDMMTPELHGLWVEPGDVDALGSSIDRLANDPQLRSRLALAARQHVIEHYSIDVVLNQLRDVYREVLSQARPATKVPI